MNILNSPLFWFLVSTVAYIIVESNKKHIKKLEIEVEAMGPFGEVEDPRKAGLVDLIGHLLMIGGMIMSVIKFSADTSAVEVVIMGILGLAVCIFMTIRLILQKKLSAHGIAFWIVRGAQAMSVISLFNFYYAIIFYPQFRVFPKWALMWGHEILMSILTLTAVLLFFVLLNLSDYVKPPEDGAYKRYLKWLPIFNPITSIFTVPLWAIYRIFRGAFRMIVSHRKAKQ